MLLHRLLIFADAWWPIFAFFGFLLAVGWFLEKCMGRSHEVDAAIAEDTRRVEHERQQKRAAIAKQRTATTERRLRAVDPLDLELAQLLADDNPGGTA